MEAMEKQMGDSNAKEWMQMIGSTGEKLIGPLINTAGAIVANKMMAKQEAQGSSTAVSPASSRSESRPSSS